MKSTHTSNEQQVLLWLLRHPLQRIRDVAMGLDLTESTTARVLQRLGGQQLVEQVTPRFRTSHRHSWYHLSSAGIKILAQQEGTDPVLLARAWQTDERHLLRLLPRLHQIIHLQDIVHSLMSHAPTALASAGYQAEIRWGWQREYRVTVRRQRQVIHCQTDAVVVFRRRSSVAQANQQEQFFTLFVYLDLGQTSAFTDRTTMVRTFRNLLLYRESRERQPYRSMFPLVMIIVESSRQLELWQQAATEAARQLRIGKPLLAVIVSLAEEPRPKTRPIWHYHWRVCSTNAFCRLEQMLVPMTVAAVPPGILTNRVTLPELRNPSRSKPPVEGHYQRRMEILLHLPHLEQVRPLAQEREIIALLSLQMSERYREILFMLYTHPLLAIEELAVFSGLPPRTVYHYVLELLHWGYVERFSQPRGLGKGSSKEASRPGRKKKDVRWALSIRGLLALSASTATSLKKLYQKGPGEKTASAGEKTPTGRVWQRGVGQLYREWKHTAGIYQCVVAFHQAVQSQPDQHIAWFETHFRCARHYQINKKWHNFRPDAVLEYVVKSQEHTRRFHLWIERDSGTMGSRALREKWRTYGMYLRSFEWRARMSMGVLPLLLIIVPDRKRLNRMMRLVQEILGDGASLHVRITTQDLFHEHGPLATIWTAVLPLPSEQPSRLRRLLDMEVAGSTRF